MGLKARERIKLLEILQDNGPLNTCQVCRVYHNKEKNDISFCRSEKVIERGLSNFKRFSHEPYEYCQIHSPKHSEVYRALKILERKHLIQSKRLRFNDPQRTGKHWDTMRFWGIDLTPILKQTMDFWCK